MGHNYLVAAFCVTWVIQLGYLSSILLKWQGQRKKLRSTKPIPINRKVVAEH